VARLFCLEDVSHFCMCRRAMRAILSPIVSHELRTPLDRDSSAFIETTLQGLRAKTRWRNPLPRHDA